MLCSNRKETTTTQIATLSPSELN